jgi:hypothetical protein
MRRLIQRIAAENRVAAQQPEVADAAHRGSDDLRNGLFADVGVLNG